MPFQPGEFAIIVRSVQPENRGKRVKIVQLLEPGIHYFNGLRFEVRRPNVYAVESADGSSLLTHPGRSETTIRTFSEHHLRRPSDFEAEGEPAPFDDALDPEDNALDNHPATAPARDLERMEDPDANDH